MTQSEALTILKTGKNVFVTGPAGSGKTYVINQYIEYLRNHKVPIGVTASTGIAATHLGGVTIHSWSGIGIKDSLSQSDLDEIAGKKYIKDKVRSVRVLLIDEVSMLHHFRLDMVDIVLKKIRKSKEPFGGVQVVLCGDFFQLPPIERIGERQARFISDAESWKEGNFTICYLEGNFRQVNDHSLGILNDIRAGRMSEESYKLLMSRKVDKGGKQVSQDEIATMLYTHNVDVDAINEAELGKMDGYETTYEMTSRGKKPLVQALKKSCLAPELLRLKVGARVICVKNNFDEGYVNGTLGVVVSCGFGGDPIVRTAPSPGFPSGRTITISKATWVIDDGEKILAEITQYPLRLAWAITVHKSQGMSLDTVSVDLSKCFEPGMGYVALSRVRTLSGLNILGMNEMAHKVNPQVLEYDRQLKILSGKAESILAHTEQSEILQAQKAFLASAAPLHSLKESKSPYKFPKEGKKKFHRWRSY